MGPRTSYGCRFLVGTRALTPAGTLHIALASAYRVEKQASMGMRHVKLTCAV